MQKYLQKITIWISVLTSLFSLAAPIYVSAQARNNNGAQNTANNGQALEIAPPVMYLNADPGQTVKAQILIRDISNGNLLVNGTVNDFTAGGEDGVPKILLDSDAPATAYSMKSWVAPLPSLLLIPREIKTMTATINVPKDASPGGHYAVVRFTSQSPGVEGNGVSLAASIGVLMLVTVSGNIKESVNVSQFYVTKDKKKGTFFDSGPISFSEQFKNTGNVHEQPSGQVEVKNMFGKKLGAVNVNVPPANVLPGSTRTFTQALDKAVIGNKRLFGRYTATLKVTYGSNKQALTAVTHFWVIPYKLVLIVIVILIALFFVLRFLIRRYNRSVVARAQRRK